MNPLERRRIPKHDSNRLEVSTHPAPNHPIPEIIVHPPSEASEPFVAVAFAEGEQAAAATESANQPTDKAAEPTTGLPPLWLCHILATFVQTRLLKLYDATSVTEPAEEDARSEFDRFWSWMTASKTKAAIEQTKDGDQTSSSEDDIPLMQLRARRIQQQTEDESSSDEDDDLPLSLVTVKRSMRDEAFTFLSSRDYFSTHDGRWWAAQLSEIEGMKKAIHRERRRNGKMLREKDRQREDSGVVKGEQTNRDRESEVGPEGSGGSAGEGGSEVDFDMLDRSEDEDEDEEEGEDAEEGGMMELDDAELTDEGIEDISSDEELYGEGPDTTKVGFETLRADSHLA